MPAQSKPSPKHTLRLQFAKNVRFARIDQELSQERLAHECGLDRTFIGSLEQGIRNISIDNIEVIARALNIPAHELLDSQLATKRGFDMTALRAPRSTTTHTVAQRKSRKR